jgi:glycosyltransferase involved in cell wall biosynthesis
MSATLRVLHILPSVRGYGAERLIVDLLGHLSSPGIDAALLTIYEPSGDVERRLTFPLLHAGRKDRRDRAFVWQLMRQIRSFKPDIVHTHTHVGKYWGRLAALLAGTRCIVHTEHNPCDGRRTPLERAADWVLHRMTARVVTFFSEQVAALSRQEGLPHNKLLAIQNGVTLIDGHVDRILARKQLSVGDDEFAIALVGRMEFQKNHALALRAFSALKPAIRDGSVLLFLGAGENESTLRDLARDLKIADRVRFLGYRADVASILPGADVLLMSSLFEGMPLALIEAMLAKVPIVTTPWLGASNMLACGRYGLIAEGFHPKQIAAQIERAHGDPELRRTLAERAEEHARRAYDIKRTADEHKAMYLRLCGSRV